MYHFLPSNFFELFSLLTLIICYKKFSRSKLKYFCPFLILTLCFELTGWYVRWILKKTNHPVFNIFALIEYLFYSGIFYSSLQSAYRKKIVKFASFCFILFVIVNMLFIQGFNLYNSYTTLVSSVLIIYWCCLFFKEIFESNTYEMLHLNPMFWISSGLFFFYLGTFFYILFWYYLVYKQIDFNGNVFFYINEILNGVLYTCFSIAFICKRKVQKF